MESSDKNVKGENGMSITFPKFSETEISKSNNNSNNTTSFGLIKFDFFDTDSSTISEFMSLSLNAKIEKVLGVIDILVNNIGIIKRISMCEIDVSEFKEVIDIDLVAPFIVAKNYMPQMI